VELYFALVLGASTLGLLCFFYADDRRIKDFRPNALAPVALRDRMAVPIMN